MKTEVNPKDTVRAEAFEMWISSPMPMVTLTKTFDVSHLIKAARKSGVKFNALLCWCIGKAATQVAAECKSSFLEDYMIVGTSAMVQTELDCIVNQYTDKFCNPMVGRASCLWNC